MYDLKWIRDNPADFDAGLDKRGVEPHADKVLALDGERRQLQTHLQELQARRNEASKAIGQAKQKGEDASELIAEVGAIKNDLAGAEERERDLASELEAILVGLPNTPADDVPVGADEAASRLERQVGDRAELRLRGQAAFRVGRGARGLGLRSGRENYPGLASS